MSAASTGSTWTPPPEPRFRRTRRLVRLGRRFFASLLARPPGEAEVAWVATILEPAELALWESMPRYDRRHTLRVARAAERGLDGTLRADPVWVAAALLHDVGKVQSGVGILGRVLGTLVMLGLGRPRVAGWADGRGWRGRFGRYAAHGRLGGVMIRAAGGREPVARWAELHHLSLRSRGLDPAISGIPGEVAQTLQGVDRD